MKTVWKYPVPICDYVTIDLPEGAQVLRVDMQGDALCLWALVNPDAPTAERVLRIAGTGDGIAFAEGDRIHAHLGTFFLHGGALVFHVFEMTR